jgi:hypothetical protein
VAKQSWLLDPLVKTFGKHFLSKLEDGPAWWDDAENLLEKAYDDEVGLLHGPALSAVVAHANDRDLSMVCDANEDFFDHPPLFDSGSHASSAFTSVSAHAQNDQAQDELASWLAFKIDWREEFILQNPGKDVSPPQSKFWTNPLDLSKHINTLLVWKRHEASFPVLKRIALRVLAVPESNGFQERVFSFLRQIDSAYRRKLTDENLELDLLLRANVDWISKRMDDTEFLRDMLDGKKVAARVRAANAALRTAMPPQDDAGAGVDDDDKDVVVVDAPAPAPSDDTYDFCN